MGLTFISVSRRTAYSVKCVCVIVRYRRRCRRGCRRCPAQEAAVRSTDLITLHRVMDWLRTGWRHRRWCVELDGLGIYNHGLYHSRQKARRTGTQERSVGHACKDSVSEERPAGASRRYSHLSSLELTVLVYAGPLSTKLSHSLKPMWFPWIPSV